MAGTCACSWGSIMSVFSLRVGRRDDDLEGTAVAQSNGGKVSHIARQHAADAEILGEHDNRRVHEAQTEIPVPVVHDHGAPKLIESRWRIGERTVEQIAHEYVHFLAVVAKEVVELRQHEAGNV